MYSYIVHCTSTCSVHTYNEYCNTIIKVLHVHTYDVIIADPCSCSASSCSAGRKDARPGANRKRRAPHAQLHSTWSPQIWTAHTALLAFWCVQKKIFAPCEKKYRYILVFVTQVEPFLMWVNTTPTNSTQIKDLYRGFCVELLEGLKKNQQQFLPFGEHFPVLKQCNTNVHLKLSKCLWNKSTHNYGVKRKHLIGQEYSIAGSSRLGRLSAQ